MSVIQSRAVEKYLKAIRSKELIHYPTWEEWLEVGAPYPDQPYEKKRITARFNRNGYDWDINGALYTPEKEVDPSLAFLVTLGTNGSEGECDVCPDGRPGIAAVLAAQGFKVMTFSFPGNFYPPDGVWPMPVPQRKPIYLFDKPDMSDEEIADRNLKCSFDTNMQGCVELIEKHLPGRGLIVTNGTQGFGIAPMLKTGKVVGHTTIGFAGCDYWRLQGRDKKGADKSHKKFPIDEMQRKSPETHRNSGYQSDAMLTPWGGPDEFIKTVSQYRSQLKTSLTVNQHEANTDVLMEYVKRTGLPKQEYFSYLDEPTPAQLKDLGVLVFVGMHDKKHWIYGDNVEDKREVFMARQFEKHSDKVHVVPVPHYGHIAMCELHNEKFVYHWGWAHKEGYFK